MYKNIKTIKLICIWIIPCYAIQVLYGPQCCGEFCVPEQKRPITAYDFSKQFNEKRYWIETNERTGQLQICSQRLGIYSEFYKSAKIYCYPARQIPCPPGVPEHCICWAADSVILCQDTITGDVNIIHKKA